jgi:hypothetical protein
LGLAFGKNPVDQSPFKTANSYERLRGAQASAEGKVIPPLESFLDTSSEQGNARSSSQSPTYASAPS